MPTITTMITTGLAAVVLLPVLALAGTSTGGTTCPSTLPPVTARSDAGSSSTVAAALRASQVPAPQWDSEQLGNAAIIVTVGRQRAVPAWGQVVALATAMQESRLRNLPGGDADSIGLFQQRPSQGWGTPAQLTSPVYQAGRFYDALLSVPSWQTLSLTQAAQAVQRSARPDAYSQWATAAEVLLAGVDSTNPRAIPEDLEQFLSTRGCVLGGGDGEPIGEDVPLPAGRILPPGTPRPIVVAIGWALAQRGTPYSYGGDCTAAHSGVAAHQCDCSSLVQMAYRAGSVSLPRTTTEQVRIGVPIADLSQLRPGDLVFIPGSDGTADSPGHVALYLGNGVAVHAPHQGDVVRLVNITSWHSMIVSVRRVVS